ncbi:cryptochrome/photolyase family protein [Mangrovibrevibacter kandeliae]|uniref:cryptochrome/photolyase family protein n=1 Tax=Mangrovibrevibacter kandeliae TaxID=2968473 RepID=UPI002117F5B6|nr:deoxyribodipyrimidine photo-lyase [Aurantimonas sp. CSK15Z-1]MCQ8781649.1 DNA photolyase family protein [Aurantimonas sp. CSK15Z-1]
MTSHDDRSPILVWFRQDLRLDDHPALAHAAETGRPVVPLYVLDEESEGLRAWGGAHRWWLHHALDALGTALKEHHLPLVLRRGPALREVVDVAKAAGAGALWYNRRYGPGERAVDEAVAEALGDLDCQGFTGTILHEPEAVQTGSGGFYRVFTPFFRKLQSLGDPRDPIDPPKHLKTNDTSVRSDRLADWNLLPKKPNWSGGIDEAWQAGEDAAHQRFAAFQEEILAGYKDSRNLPAEDGTSRMSPHLHWGSVSPYRLWHDAQARGKGAEGAGAYRRELAWRDFNYHLLFHVADFTRANYDKRFDRFPWRKSPKDLEAWQQGRTGYPLVDAGMRQLWQTGWMHNRVRMVAASFLTKHLLIDWRAGEAWFWDTLVDGDAANNVSQWQWVAGCGADAQPFFRIFNPIGQSRKFDKGGDYIRRFVPELAALPDKAIHAPWEAGEDVLDEAGVALGKTYPKPIVDHEEARKRALDAFAMIRG